MGGKEKRYSGGWKAYRILTRGISYLFGNVHRVSGSSTSLFTHHVVVDTSEFQRVFSTFGRARRRRWGEIEVSRDRGDVMVRVVEKATHMTREGEPGRVGDQHFHCTFYVTH